MNTRLITIPTYILKGISPLLKTLLTKRKSNTFWKMLNIKTKHCHFPKDGKVEKVAWRVL